MLYAFIVLPVESWHHHAYNAVGNSGNSSVQIKINTHEQVVQSDTGSELECKICSHKYSSYSNDIFVHDIIAPANFCEVKGAYKFYSPAIYAPHLSNKSPPQNYTVA